MSRGVYGDGRYRHVRYDAAGRISLAADTMLTGEHPMVCEPFPSRICEPDPNQLIVTYTPALLESYTYDAVGNRTDHSAVITAGNRLTSFNGYTLTYDDDGNLVSKSGHGHTQTFTWNALGQLVQVITDGAYTTFSYDGLGRRIRKSSSAGVTSYLYDGDNLVMQLDGAGQPVLEFSYYPGVDHPHAVRKSSTGAVYYYVTEQPGHVTELVNQSNQVVNSYQYTPFGESISATEQVVQPFRFAGRELDSETGLYYNRARYYDPSLARFISEDPVGLEGGVNPYAYVENDPIDQTDPFGLAPCTKEQLARGAIEATFSDGNTVCKEPTTLPPIIVSAAAPPSTWPSILGMGIDWVLGSGETYRYFGAGSGEVTDMQSAQGVRLYRSLACASGGESVKGAVSSGRRDTERQERMPRSSL